MHSNDCVPAGSNLYDDTDYQTVHFHTSLYDFVLESRSQRLAKAKNSVPIISQSLRWIWMKFGKLLRFVSLMNFVLS